MIAGRGRGRENENVLTEEERSFEYSLEVREMDNVNAEGGEEGQGEGGEGGRGRGGRVKAARPTVFERSDWPVEKLGKVLIG